eukprot:COSAG06_NODE_6270_length_3003_cov_2.170455_2_plen_55_part_00
MNLELGLAKAGEISSGSQSTTTTGLPYTLYTLPGQKHLTHLINRSIPRHLVVPA